MLRFMALLPEPFDPYEVADARLLEKEQRLIKELEGVRSARASIAIARHMSGAASTDILHSPNHTTTNHLNGNSTAATVVSGIAGGPYYGLGLAEAAIKNLSLCNKTPQTVKKIWKVLSEAGVSILSDKPEAALSWALRKRERKNGDVVLVGNGEWGLAEWYPGQVEQIRAARNNASSRNRDEHVERTKLGMALAKGRRGVKFGAKTKVTPELIERAKVLLAEPGATVAAVAKKLDISKASMYGHKLTLENYGAKDAKNLSEQIRSMQ
jgi:hypothetical protein